MITINKLSFSYVIGDLLLIIISLFLGKYWLINTQAAFICSMLITFASFFSYKIMIEKRVDAGDIGEDRDFYDELEDPYRLYGDKDNHKEKNITCKPKTKKVSSFKQMVKGLVSGISGALSVYRLLSYTILFLAILYMVRQGVFSAIPFFIGLSIVPFISLLFGLFGNQSRA